MQQKRGNKTHNALARIIVLTLGVSTLVVGSASALTLDSAIIRNIPFFQKLLITTEGDQSSTSVVELSGTNNQLIRILPVMGTSTILQAPLGQFVKTSEISGSAFAQGAITNANIVTGSIGPEDFAFNIYTYYSTIFGGSWGGGGSVNNGSCPAGQVATAFSNGTIVCSSAPVVSSLPSPLCTSGTYFAGWAGLGLPLCSTNVTGSAFSQNGGDYWVATPLNLSDIYFGIASGWSSLGFGSGAIPGRQILQLVQTQYINLNAGYVISPEACTCSVPFASVPNCTLYSGGNVPPGYIADAAAQAKINTLSPAYAFADPKVYLDYNGQGTGFNACSDWFMSGSQTWVNSYLTTGPLVTWSTPTYSGSFKGNEKVGVGLATPLETLHVAGQSTGMTLQTVTVAGPSGSIYYTPGPLKGALYAVKLGTLNPGYLCPCDTNPNSPDTCANGVYNRTFPQYNYAFGAQSCYDMDTSNDGYYSYNMNVSFASNIFTLTLGATGTFHSFGRPRCACDTSASDGNCQQGQMNLTYPSTPWTPSDGYYFHGGDQGPSCYEVSWGGGAPGYLSGPWRATKFDKVWDEFMWQFKSLSTGSAYTTTPSCSCDNSSRLKECSTPIFTGNNASNTAGANCIDRYTGSTAGTVYMSYYTVFTSTSPAISATGVINYTTGATTVNVVNATGSRPTLRSDDQGSMLKLVDKAEDASAGTIGALSVQYNGAILYVNGGQVGINNSNPQAELDVAGSVRFANISRPGADLLSVDNQGNLLATGDVSVFTSQWLNTTTWTGLNSAIQYSPGLTGAVLIGTNTNRLWAWPWLKLYVDGDVTANTMFGYSDQNLKENLVALPASLALSKLLTVRGYTYQWTADGREDVGLLAQEIAGIYPTVVETFQHPQLNGGAAIKVINYEALIAAVIQATKQIHTKILDAGEERLREQREKIQTLLWRVEGLEQGGRWDGYPQEEYDWGDTQPGPTCQTLTYSPNVQNYQTNNSQTNVQLRCYTSQAQTPVPAIIECGNGQMMPGQASDGNPFIANCIYDTPTNGTARCLIEGQTTASCQLPVDIQWDG